LQAQQQLMGKYTAMVTVRLKIMLFVGMVDVKTLECAQLGYQAILFLQMKFESLRRKYKSWRKYKKEWRK